MPRKRKATNAKVETSLEAGDAKKKTINKGYQKSVPIPIGEIVTDIRKQQWKIGTRIGSGGFGDIHAACKVGESSEDYLYAIKFEPHDNGPLFLERSVYMKLANIADIEKFRKQRKLTTIGMPHYVGSGTFNFDGSKHRFLVIPRYGRDVWSFFLENGKKLPEATVYRIAIQMLDVLEYIHQCNYIHADLKGTNIVLGYGNIGAGQVYLVDFGLASHLTKEFTPDKKKMHNGTIEYTSRDAHNGLITMRSDMEVLAYNIIHWCGITLPWEADGLLASPRKVQESKKKFMSDVEASLKRYYPSCPDVITTYVKYVAKLAVDATPDYTKCRKMFETALKQLGEKNSGDLKFTLSSNVGSATQSKVNIPTPPKKKTAKVQLKLPNETFSDDSSSSETENELRAETAVVVNDKETSKTVLTTRSKIKSTDDVSNVEAIQSTADASKAAKSLQNIQNGSQRDDSSSSDIKSPKKTSLSRKRVAGDKATISNKVPAKRSKTTPIANKVNDVVNGTRKQQKAKLSKAGSSKQSVSDNDEDDLSSTKANSKVRTPKKTRR